MRNVLKIYLNESGRRTDCVAEKMLMDRAVVFVCKSTENVLSVEFLYELASKSGIYKRSPLHTQSIFQR